MSLNICEIASAVLDQLDGEAANYEIYLNSIDSELRSTERRIQIERICNILSVCNEKLRFAFQLPNIVDRVLDEFNDDQLFAIKWNSVAESILVSRFECVHFWSLDWLTDDFNWYFSFTECHVKKCESIAPSAVDDICSCIDLAFEKCRNVRQDCDNSVKHHTLDLLDDFKSIIVHKITLTAAQSLAKEKILHRIWVDCEHLEREIASTESEIGNVESIHYSALEEKRDKIGQHELALLELHCQNDKQSKNKM